MSTEPHDLAAWDLDAWLPRALDWAREQRDASLAAGRPLEAREIELARAVGVGEPERIRLHVVEHFPRPEAADLRRVADHFDFFGQGMLGLTLGHAVLVDARQEGSERLLRHEFRHVQQVEAAGSFETFLVTYLGQIVAYGYADAPLEVDARSFETAPVGTG